MRVVKLGGSLLETGKLFACLKHITAQNQKTVVVCGGGFFADAVREAQKKWQFDDVAAHEMAILSMQQITILCQNLHPEFVLFSKTATLANSSLAIWFPDLNELNEANVPPSWEITSDSLAAWLANKLNAVELVIVKSCDIDSSLTLNDLIQRGIVDPQFHHFVANAKFPFNIFSVDTFLST